MPFAWGARCVWAAAAVVVLLLAAAPAGATPYIHAHRGGSIAGGQPTYAENTIPAFVNAAAKGFVLELDAKLTSDGVPLVIHDATLDRTTNCTGLVRSRTADDIRSNCQSDVLGTAGNSSPLPEGDPRRVTIPSLAEVLALAREARARVNVEIKNIPAVEPDFDSTTAFTDRVMNVVIASGIPTSQVIIQSFYPPNLDRAKVRLPAVATSLLTLRELNDGAPADAKAQGYEFVSPQWPPADPPASYVANAHQLGRRIVPFTLNSRTAVQDAARAGVDEIITDDPEMARSALAEIEPPAPEMPPPPTAAECEPLRAARSREPIEAYDDTDPRAPRVFAMQFKQDVRHVETYATFRKKIECMIRDYVLPRLASGRPNVVAFNEDIGLATIATGTRGQATRRTIDNPGPTPSCEGDGAPCGTIAAFGEVSAAYGPQLAAYNARFGSLDSPNKTVAKAFVAATDTFARGWMQTFSDMATRYGVYILGSNNQSPFRESRDLSEIGTFQDPDQPNPPSVYVATDDDVFNEVFMWGPDRVREEGPRPLKNVVVTNKKVPITPIERIFQLTDGPSTGPDAIENVRPYQVPGSEARISFATSLPAFVYGPVPPAGVDPCSNTARYYMRCLDRLGANLVMQDEANPARWGADAGSGVWQPLEWMLSTYRAVEDPTVSFPYNVTPHMVGNLADLPFDGQTAVTQRGLATGPGCNYVGNSAFLPSPNPEADPASLEKYTGSRTGFLALVPWVAADGPRDELRRIGERLAPGSGDTLENDYLETAVAADLPFPPNNSRRSCATEASAPPVGGGGTGGGDTGGGDTGGGDTGGGGTGGGGTGGGGTGGDAPGAGGPGAGDPPGGGPGEGSVPGTGGSPGAQPLGPCRNEITGTRGANVLRGTSVSDLLRGLGGADRIFGRGASDCIRGGGGNDVLAGGAGADRMVGGRGADRLLGGPGGDRLAGDAGADRLVGGRGRNRYAGGTGNDTIYAVNRRRERIDCGGGPRDSVRADRSDRLVRCERIHRA